MIISKLAKAFILGMCITMLTSTAAFAESGGGQQGVSISGQAAAGQQAVSISGQAAAGQPAANPGKLPAEGYKPVGAGQTAPDAGMAPNAAVSSPALAAPAVSEKMLQKQSEIDQYLFEKHKDEIAKMGFKVTHTAPFENYVEIGITPYTKANADSLYRIFGSDMVKVVEGQQAVPMDIKTISPNGAEIYTVTAAAEAKDPKDASSMASPTVIALICAAGVALIGGTAFMKLRHKAANR